MPEGLEGDASDHSYHSSQTVSASAAPIGRHGEPTGGGACGRRHVRARSTRFGRPCKTPAMRPVVRGWTQTNLSFCLQLRVRTLGPELQRRRQDTDFSLRGTFSQGQVKRTLGVSMKTPRHRRTFKRGVRTKPSSTGEAGAQHKRIERLWLCQPDRSAIPTLYGPPNRGLCCRNTTYTVSITSKRQSVRGSE